MTTSCARSRAPSFAIAWLTWVRAVAGLRNSLAPISSLLSPCPTRARTSRSRWVSTASRSSATRVAIRSAVNWAIRRRVIRGASNASPAATTRMACNSSAGPASLSRKPLAPAWSASKTYASVSYVVRIRTRTCSRPRVRTIPLVALIPSSSGMRMSMSTTSGRVARARSTASAPLAASPTTVMSSSASSSTLTPDLQDIGAVVERDRHPRGADVADHVGDRLLQDPVGGVVHRARYWHGRRGHLELDVESGLARHRGERVDLSQAGVRRPPVVRVAKHAEDGPHLVQRLGAGLLDRHERLAHPFRALAELVRGDAGLHVDDGDGV